MRDRRSIRILTAAALPLLAEIFGVTIDDLFDLTAEQRFNRIEHRMDIEDELPQDVFHCEVPWQVGDFLHLHRRTGRIFPYRLGQLDHEKVGLREPCDDNALSVCWCGRMPERCAEDLP